MSDYDKPRTPLLPPGSTALITCVVALLHGSSLEQQALAVAVVYAAARLAVWGIALIGSRYYSERAFRLLRLMRGHPEPPAPSENNRG